MEIHPLVLQVWLLASATGKALDGSPTCQHHAGCLSLPGTAGGTVRMSVTVVSRKRKLRGSGLPTGSLYRSATHTRWLRYRETTNSGILLGYRTSRPGIVCRCFHLQSSGSSRTSYIDGRSAIVFRRIMPFGKIRKCKCICIFYNKFRSLGTLSQSFGIREVCVTLDDDDKSNETTVQVSSDITAICLTTSVSPGRR